MEPINTVNVFVVCAMGTGIVIQNPPRTIITADEALNLAAWLVALVADRERFDNVLKAIENT
jgi:hypothetical protein